MTQPSMTPEEYEARVNGAGKLDVSDDFDKLHADEKPEPIPVQNLPVADESQFNDLNIVQRNPEVLPSWFEIFNMFVLGYMTKKGMDNTLGKVIASPLRLIAITAGVTSLLWVIGIIYFKFIY